MLPQYRITNGSPPPPPQKISKLLRGPCNTSHSNYGRVPGLLLYSRRVTTSSRTSSTQSITQFSPAKPPSSNLLQVLIFSPGEKRRCCVLGAARISRRPLTWVGPVTALKTQLVSATNQLVSVRAHEISGNVVISHELRLLQSVYHGDGFTLQLIQVRRAHIATVVAPGFRVSFRHTKLVCNSRRQGTLANKHTTL